jgi:(4S)-4-hydroxy-5-phosphonooxypentane-2,3-dione isomerase
MPLGIYIEYTPRAGCRDTLLTKLREEAESCVRDDDGCLRMEFAVPEKEDDSRVLLIELWRDRAALDAHSARPGHSHAWQEPLVESKRVSVCTVVASPEPGR